MMNSFEEKNGLYYENFKANSYAINVFYSNMEYTVISETPKTSLFDLISQIGGSLGMFLEFSVFHIVEIFEIVCLILHVLS